MQPHKTVSNDEWTAARKVLLAKEKELTRLRDEYDDVERAPACCGSQA